MLLTVERVIRGRIFHAMYQYTTANNKYMKYHKTRNHHILCKEMKTIYADGQCLKKSTDNFK